MIIKCSGLLLNYNGQPAHCRTGRYDHPPGCGHFWHLDRQVQMETSHTDVCKKKKLGLCGGLQTRFKTVFPVMLRSDHCAKNEGDRCTINQNNGLSRIAYSPLHLHLKKFTSAQHIQPGLVGDALPRPWKLVGLRGVVWAIPKHNVWTITSWDCGGCTARDLIRWTACHVSARYWGILPAWVIEQLNRQRKWEYKCHITSCCHIQRNKPSGMATADYDHHYCTLFLPYYSQTAKLKQLSSNSSDNERKKRRICLQLCPNSRASFKGHVLLKHPRISWRAAENKMLPHHCIAKQCSSEFNPLLNPWVFSWCWSQPHGLISQRAMNLGIRARESGMGRPGAILEWDEADGATPPYFKLQLHSHALLRINNGSIYWSPDPTSWHEWRMHPQNWLGHSS